MKAPSLLIAALLALFPLPAAQATDPVGFRLLAVPSAPRGQMLQTPIWYPAAPGGSVKRIGEDRLFQGFDARKDAPVAPGLHPLIVVSHGSGGNTLNLGWLTTRLAEAGFIVAGPAHPGTTRGNSTPLDTTRIWERPADISATIDSLTADPQWRAVVDRGRIGVLGFSLGGHTALAVAGARVRLEDYARYCEANPKMPDCVWFASGGVDLRTVDRSRFEGAMTEPRVASVLAVDPSIVQALVPSSLTEIQIPVTILNLGAPDDLPVAVDARDKIGLIPRGRYRMVAGAVHLSFLAECQNGARAFLATTGDADPLCDDAPGAPKTRAQIHAELAEIIIAAFRKDLAAQ